MERKNLVFVYGTLRNGRSNHHLLKDAYCHGVGRSEASYAMYLKNGYPYITSSENRYQIVGELYSVDDDTLLALDRFEGHPRHYKRREIQIVVGEERYNAWSYFRDPPGVLMHTGDFDEASLDKLLDR